MKYTAENLRPTGKVKFVEANKCLLPNEDRIFVCQINIGFLVLSNCRVVFLHEQRDWSFTIDRVIPLDCILECKHERTDHFKLIAVGLDENGCYETEIRDGSTQYTTKEIEVRAPKSEKNESKEDVLNNFQESMNYFIAVLGGGTESETFSEEVLPRRDQSYLDILPESLTCNAILDLNNVLQDKPIYDELYHEAKKFLGEDAFILEESLRDGHDEKSGILFAAGTQGYIWIRGKKEGRYLEDVLVDKVEWENIKCLVHQWQQDDGQIKAVYTLQKGSKELVVPYVWSPKIDDDTRHYQWLLQKLNGPWILADIMYKYTDQPLPASWISEKHLQESDLQKQRYYY